MSDVVGVCIESCGGRFVDVYKSIRHTEISEHLVFL